MGDAQPVHRRHQGALLGLGALRAFFRVYLVELLGGYPGRLHQQVADRHVTEQLKVGLRVEDGDEEAGALGKFEEMHREVDHPVVGFRKVIAVGAEFRIFPQ